MWLIVGLGNPGEKYEETRHNLGFIFVERLVDKLDFPKGSIEFHLNKKINAMIAKTDIYGEQLIIAKPHSFMNRSGEVVKGLLDYFELDSDRLIVVSDDCNLEVGRARIRDDGESGGHKGLESIISHLGLVFWRIRIGIGATNNMPLEDYVLKNIPKKDLAAVNGVIDKTIGEVISLLSRDKLENLTI